MIGYRLRFRLLHLPTPGRNARRHWRVRWSENAAWNTAVGFAVRGREPPEPLEQAHLIFTRHSSVEPDPTNLADSFKPIEDALRYAGVLANDRRQNIGAPQYRWKPEKPRHGWIEVEVLDRDAYVARAADSERARARFDELRADEPG